MRDIDLKTAKIKIRTKSISKSSVRGGGKIIVVEFIINGEVVEPVFFGDSLITKNFQWSGLSGKYYFLTAVGEYETLTDAKNEIKHAIRSGIISIKSPELLQGDDNG